ncbi:phosphoglycolate phosphatase [Devosia lucknowensis]|uniref:Phosphoglycolate phosphatase n=1 Tax=Devosia lucknowensis TaxID=1096929 RepID=A0A1Y6EBK3_9HYPH|nr:HAD-IA family hydrolase [Devosia lucknowensis]SMQ59849.1 phosphoglycolate phosphatase [Devosia lucknowensis]
MPLKPGAALLFDIDGTLVESDPLHLEAFNIAFAPYGHTFDRDRFGRELQGLANAAIGARFFPAETPERQWEIMMGKEAKFRELAAKGIEPVAGLMGLLDWADAHDVPMVAVTNAPRPNADLLIDAIGIRARFRHVVIGDELAHGKPHPLPYLEGLRLLGADAAHSVAFEDSRTGIASATGAGIATVGLATGLKPEQLVEAGAVLAAHDYTGADLLEFVERRLFG